MFENLNKKSKSNSENPLTINFLSSQNLEGTKIGKIINWALSVGKVIVFITFTIVIGAYVYRFSLDQKLEDLQEKIEANIDGINENNLIENKIRKTQEKLDGVREIVNNSSDFNLALRKLEESIPITVYLDKLSLGVSGIVMSGIADNEMSFGTFLSALQAKDEFEEIIVDEISSGGNENPEVNFSINLRIAKKEI